MAATSWTGRESVYDPMLLNVPPVRPCQQHKWPLVCILGLVFGIVATALFMSAQQPARLADHTAHPFLVTQQGLSTPVHSMQRHDLYAPERLPYGLNSKVFGHHRAPKSSALVLEDVEATPARTPAQRLGRMLPQAMSGSVLMPWLLGLSLSLVMLGWKFLIWRPQPRASCGRAQQLWAIASSIGYETEYEADELQGMRVSELKKLAEQHGVPTQDCFSKEDIVDKLLLVPAQPQPGTAQGPAAATSERTTARSDAAVREELKGLTIRQLRTKIFEAGLSSKGFVEKQEFIDKAVEAQHILDQRPKFPDADLYNELEIAFYGRPSCPYCVQALEGLQKRGLMQGGWADPALRNVETSAQASQELQALGGTGVPFFYSPKTKKKTSGWKQGESTLDWLIRQLQ